jgi:hypothetical protein
LLLAAGSASAQDLGTCGDLHNAYGSFDYRTDRRELVVVEAYHFSVAVEQLVRGIGQNLANKGVQNQMTITSQQELGGLSSSVAQSQAAQRAKNDKGRQ